MSVKILIQDLFLDFTCSKDISIERRFFVEIELNKNNQEILVFMNEMNSVFHQTKKLSNIVLLNNKDIAEDFSTENSNKNVQEHKELIILEDDKVYSSLKKLVVHNIESCSEELWLSFCQKIYDKRKVDFTLQHKQNELDKFFTSNLEIKTLWASFPNSMKQFQPSGELIKAQTIPDKFSKFWKQLHYFHLNTKLEEKEEKEKKPKI